MNLRLVLKIAPLLGLLDDLIDLAKKRLAATAPEEEQKINAEMDNLAKKVTPVVYSLLPESLKDTATDAEALAFAQTADDLGIALVRTVQAAVQLFKP